MYKWKKYLNLFRKVFRVNNGGKYVKRGCYRS